MNGEYALSMAGPGGEYRHIAVFVSLRGAAGRVSGGAQVTTSQTRAVIYLVPSIDEGWLTRRPVRLDGAPIAFAEAGLHVAPR